MPKFNVTVSRTATRTLTLSVDASTRKEAEDIALDEAPNHEFPSEKTAEYGVEGSVEQA